MVNALTQWVVLNATVNQDTDLMSHLISASIKMNVAKEVDITVMRSTKPKGEIPGLNRVKSLLTRLLLQLHACTPEPACNPTPP